ncbi:hypothetical protein GGF46_000600 [Coemansia sp. RSA 552]|nr:hypothetical protein GGF46_000600 [Coemansia sp. RSA 552]
MSTYFDTPEGRWALLSEFASEEAANQFTPLLPPRLAADDLCLGSSTEPAPQQLSQPPSTPTSVKFGIAGSAMASGSLVFPNSPATMPSALAPSSPAAGAIGPRTHTLPNRPTTVMAFRNVAAGAEGESAPKPPMQGSSLASDSVHSRSGFRQGLRGLSRSTHQPSQQQQQQQQQAHGRGVVTKSTSAFVSRIISNENLARWVLDSSTYLMFNAPRCMVLMGMSIARPDSDPAAEEGDDDGEQAVGETLARLDLATNTPLCFDVNQMTRSESRQDIIMGFVHGNIVWFEAISGRYSRLNKNSGYAPAITSIRWIPASENLFIAGTADGCVMIMDREKEDFSLPSFTSSSASSMASSAAAPMDRFETAYPQKPKCNPVAFWRVGTRPITSIEFSPDRQRVAVTGEDGALRIIDYLQETLEDVYLAYFGALTCCAWSPDGRYVVAGGKDDLLTVWSYYDQSVVARCQGHQSWVRAVAFDPLGHENENTYRFVSVGDDARLLVWDFSLAALHRPRAPHLHRSTTRGSTGPVDPPAEKPGGSTTAQLWMPRGSVAVLQPMVAEAIHDAPICSLQFCHSFLITACRRGIIKMWKRPKSFDLSSFL